MKRFVPLLGRAALVLTGLLGPLIIVEITARLLGLAPPAIPNPNIWQGHSQLGWWHMPNSGGTFYSSFNEFATDVTINDLGLRDDLTLTSYDNPAGAFRLLILADSFGEALQVSLEQTFYKRLQAIISDDGQPAQTINAGVGSWGTDQESLYYALEGHKFQPDLTLLFFFTRNDVVNNHKPLEVARNGGSIQKNFYRLDEAGNLIPPKPFDAETAYDEIYPKPAPLPPAPWLKAADWLWLHSHLYRWIVPYLNDIPPLVQSLGPSGILGGEGRIRATHPSIPVPFYVYQTPVAADWEAGWQLTEAIVASLRDQIEADGGQFAVIIIPAREQVYTTEWEQTLRANPAMQALTWDINLPNQKLAEIFQRQKIVYLDLLPAFQAEASQSEADRLYFQHDGHWTETGHIMASETIFQFLQQRDLLR